jgi:hypothetical protein
MNPDDVTTLLDERIADMKIEAGTLVLSQLRPRGRDNLQVPLTEVLYEAVHLLSEDGENHEYDRAIIEMVVRIFGLSHDEHTGAVAAVLRALKP